MQVLISTRCGGSSASYHDARAAAEAEEGVLTKPRIASHASAHLAGRGYGPMLRDRLVPIRPRPRRPPGARSRRHPRTVSHVTTLPRAGPPRGPIVALYALVALGVALWAAPRTSVNPRALLPAMVA